MQHDLVFSEAFSSAYWLGTLIKLGIILKFKQQDIDFQVKGAQDKPAKLGTLRVRSCSGIQKYPIYIYQSLGIV